MATSSSVNARKICRCVTAVQSVLILKIYISQGSVEVGFRYADMCICKTSRVISTSGNLAAILDFLAQIDVSRRALPTPLRDQSLI